MCWSESMSWLSAIVGYTTILLAVLLRRADAMLGWWAFCLLMQIPDVLEWRGVRVKLQPDLRTAHLAFLLNILQPVAALVATSVQTQRVDAMSVGVICVYLAAVLSSAPVVQIDRPTTECSHLHYRWWNKALPISLYFISTLVCLRTLPSHLRTRHAAIFIGSALLSALTVKPCGIASVWCWSVFVISLTNIFIRNENTSMVPT